MSAASKRSFFKNLKRSRLLTDEQLIRTRLWAQSIDDPQKIADRLVENGRLTRWQSLQLLSGRRGFFLGKYKLLKVCGRGGMGVVFKAEQTDIGRSVAIKALHRSLLKKERAVARFMREIRSAATLSHPNIALAYDADCIGDCYYLVMEYVSGKSLKSWIKVHKKLPIAWSCECIRQAALGLQHIDERGLVHRDIKPSNLLVIAEKTSDPQVIKILDVGLARFASEAQNEGDLTRAGQIVGTIDYMAPEQAKNARLADIRADIFGLGCTLFHMLTGQAPLVGATVVETYVARATEEAPLLSSLRPEVSPGLDAVVAKMLQRDPDQRFQTPVEVAEALASITLGLPMETVTTSFKSTTDSGSHDSSSGLGSSFGAESAESLNVFLDQLSGEARDEQPPVARVTARSANDDATGRTGIAAATRHWLRSFFRRSERTLRVRSNAEPRPPARGSGTNHISKPTVSADPTDPVHVT